MSRARHTIPAVSVLLPVHNGERYLREALDSILAQTFRDFELIALDDGSTDGTLALLREYAARDSRIRIVSRQQRGLVATLNEGIDLARGEWLARMDADDIALPHRIELQLAQLKKTGADFCGGAVQCFGDWPAVWRYPVSHEACVAHMLFDVPFAHPAVIGRRTAFARLRYAQGFARAQDYDFWQRAWAAGYRFTNVSEIVLRYRVHAGQVSSRHRDRQRQGADIVRRRHWQALLPSMPSQEIERIVDAMSHGRGKTAWLVPALRELLSRYSGEALRALLSGGFRAFCKLAGDDPQAARSWWVLTQYADSYRNRFGKVLVLLLISLLRVAPDTPLSLKLRRLRAALWR